MATMSEVGAARAYLIATAKADTALMAAAPGGVWADYAPDGTATPFVVVSLVSAPDVLTQNRTRVYNRSVWLVKGVAEAKKGAQLETIQARIDALFGRFTGADANATYLGGYRQELIDYPELINTVLWKHQGARIAIGAQLL